MSNLEKNIYKIKNLKVYFQNRKNLKDFFKKERKENYIKAVDDVSLDIFENEVLGIVGETGCGKTTLIQALLMMNKIKEGEIYYQGKLINNIKGRDLMDYYSNVQLIWQNPFSSLNPRMTVYEIISRPLIRFKRENKKTIRNKILKIIKHVGLNLEDLNKYPHEFSGGGRQRIVLARALIIEPNIIIADEPTSSLDVSIQAQILNLLKNLKESFNLTMVFVSHNIAVINFISDRVAIMYFGKIVEILQKKDLFNKNFHHYTKKLIDSVPKGERKIETEVTLEKRFELNYKGCIYYYRCEKSKPKCLTNIPKLKEIEKGHSVACFYPLI